MRLSTDLDRDEARSTATVAAALAAGIRVFDTARAYGRGEGDEGHNERLVAGALRDHAAREPSANPCRLVTKCGMRRDGKLWVPDGRAKAIVADAEASVAAVGGVPIDLLLLHAPDPNVPLATSVRALDRAREGGLVRRIGVSNVSRKQLEEAMSCAPISAVEVALGAYDDVAVRGGVVDLCLKHGIEVLAHAPLGGPERAGRLARDPLLQKIVRARDPRRNGTLTGADVFLAYLLAVRPEIVPVVGARKPETIGRLLLASELELTEGELALIDERYPVLADLRRPPSVKASDAEVVLMMGVPGAGKSRAAMLLAERGYERLNRDTLGGTLRGIAKRLDERLRNGALRLVLDNTYVTRAVRNDVVRVARAHGATIRCVYHDTSIADAQVNVVLRMLQRFDRLLEPAELAALSKSEPAALAPNAISRMARELEPPSADEGFQSVEVVPFVRQQGTGAGAVFVARSALGAAEDARVVLASLLAHVGREAPCLIFDWRPEHNEVGAFDEAIVADVPFGRVVETATCFHAAGPPVCWCRPPLPGLFVEFARRRGADLRASTVFGSTTTDKAVARVIGAAFVDVGSRRGR